MPIVGIRVRIWRIRFKMKNIEANIMPVLMSGGCGYRAKGEEPSLCERALYWKLLLQRQLIFERLGRISGRPARILRCPVSLKDSRYSVAVNVLKTGQ